MAVVTFLHNIHILIENIYTVWTFLLRRYLTLYPTAGTKTIFDKVKHLARTNRHVKVLALLTYIIIYPC